MTALHAGATLLDVTLPDLGATLEWSQVHRVRPRAPLTCRVCVQPVAAKISSRGQRFFAYDAASGCPSTGETAAHRLLKSELAAAIRAVPGWTAELETAGTGWRADVLAISPDGTRRIAWEAQLASATVEELQERTATMRAELAGVCWVTDKDVPWVERVPSIRIRLPGPDELGNGLLVVAGLAKYAQDWCVNRDGCRYQPWGLGRQPKMPCDGHGEWERPPGITLPSFVAAELKQTVVAFTVGEYALHGATRHPGGTAVWTTPSYIRAEATASVTATYGQACTLARQLGDMMHGVYTKQWLDRQHAALPGVVLTLSQQSQGRNRVCAGEPDAALGMGLPVRTDGHLTAVVCPLADRIDDDVRVALHDVIVVVASEHERLKIAARCHPATRVVVTDLLAGLLLGQSAGTG